MHPEGEERKVVVAFYGMHLPGKVVLALYARAPPTKGFEPPWLRAQSIWRVMPSTTELSPAKGFEALCVRAHG